MSWEAIGAVGEVLGAIGVIGSLVYLARQIHQNSELLTRSTEVVIRMDANLALLKSGTLDHEIHAIWDRMLEQHLHHPRFQRLWQSGAIERFVTASFAARIRERLQAGSEPARGVSSPSSGAGSGAAP